MKQEQHYAVWLGDRKVGFLNRREDYTWFVFDPSYLEAKERPILGLRFEQNLKARYASNLRLPAWFSNLLPEGRLRSWIADQRGVSAAREIELLAEIGHDLPGAVRVLRADGEGPIHSDAGEIPSEGRAASDGPTWRFSLAGVVMKFSLLSQGERFCAPSSGQTGDWIVKLPMVEFPEVPRNEFLMMELARRVGIEVPETKLVHRDLLPDIPSAFWPKGETVAYAVKRFDRAEGRRPVHIEDFAQVRDFYPGDYEKYRGSFETLGALVYRGHDPASLTEFARRLALNIIIRNGDAHLKNWSLIYRNPTTPTLSPAYDIVSTAVYRDQPQQEGLGLKLAGSRKFQKVSLVSFDALQSSLESVFGKIPGVRLRQEAEQVVENVAKQWPGLAAVGEASSTLLDKLGSAIDEGILSLQR